MSQHPAKTPKMTDTSGCSHIHNGPKYKWASTGSLCGPDAFRFNPDPSHYRSLTAFRLAQAERALAADFSRKLRRLILSAVATVGGILALINFPAYTLAVVCLGGPVLILLKAWLDCRWEAKRYKEEHDL